MIATIEISLYPLNDDYINNVLEFIEALHQHEGLNIETNGMSTQIFGEYHTVMRVLQSEMFETLQKYNAIFVLKIGKGELRYQET